jgi:hypothetical protein
VTHVVPPRLAVISLAFSVGPAAIFAAECFKSYRDGPTFDLVVGLGFGSRPVRLEPQRKP